MTIPQRRAQSDKKTPRSPQKTFAGSPEERKESGKQKRSPPTLTVFRFLPLLNAHTEPFAGRLVQNAGIKRLPIRILFSCFGNQPASLLKSNPLARQGRGITLDNACLSVRLVSAPAHAAAPDKALFYQIPQLFCGILAGRNDIFSILKVISP